MSPIEPMAAQNFASGWWIPDLAFAALRVMAAFILVRYGLQQHYGLLVDAGDRWLRAPTMYSDVWFAATIALVGGSFLALGLFTRVVTLVLALAVVAVYFVAPFAGWAAPELMLGTPESVGLYTLVLLSFAAIGPGLFSVDAIVASVRSRPSGRVVTMSPWIKRQYRHRELTR